MNDEKKKDSSRPSRWGKNSDRRDQSSSSSAVPSAISDPDAIAALFTEATQRAAAANPSNSGSSLSHSKKRPPQDTSKSFKRPRDADNDYYGPASDVADAEVEKEKPDFGLSGALMGASGASGGGTLYKGVVLKFQEPADARTPHTQWRLYVFKDDKEIATLHIAKQSAYLIGRNSDIADIHLEHPSISSQHAVLQYRAVRVEEKEALSCRPYLMDLESTNGSFINGVRIDAARYYQLRKGDVLRFGSSTREYVLLSA